MIAFADGSAHFITDHVATGAQTTGVNPDPAAFGTWQRLNSSADGLAIETGF
jgi:hypothetical protein